MDLSALNSYNMASSYVPFSSKTSMPDQNSASSFEEILKRTQKSQSSPMYESNITPLAPKKIVIDKTDKLYESCIEFETIFIKNLIKSMRSTIQKTNLIDTGFAGEIYEDMLYDEYAKSFARNASLGFAEMAYRDLTKNQ